MKHLIMLDNRTGRKKHTASSVYAKVKPVAMTLEEMAQAWMKGNVIIPAHLTNANVQGSFVSTSLIALDVDNSEGKDDEGNSVRIADEYYLTYQEAITLFEEAGFTPSLVYTTYSHTEEWHRFRIVFEVDELIEDNEKRLQVLVALGSVMAKNGRLLVDKSCTNANRFFYGGHTVVFNSFDFPVCLSAIKLGATTFSGKPLKKATPCNNNSTKQANVGKENGSIGQSSTKQLEAIEQGDIKQWQSLLDVDALNEYGDFNFNMPYQVPMTLEEVKNLPLSLLLGEQPQVFHCILHSHEDNNPSAYYIQRKDGTEGYCCHSCGVSYDIFDVVMAYHDKPFRWALNFVFEALNIQFTTKFRMRQQARVIAQMEYMASDKFLADYPVLAKSLRRYSEWAHLKFYMNEALQFLGDCSLLGDGKLSFYQTQEQSRKRMIDAHVPSNSVPSVQAISEHLRKLGLIVAYSYEELNVTEQKKVTAWLKAEKKKNSGKTRFHTYMAIPDYDHAVLQNAQDIIISDRKAGVTKKGRSRVQATFAYGAEKAKAIYTQSQNDGLNADEKKFFARMKEVVEELVDAQGYAHEKEVLAKIRIKGMDKRYKETSYKKFLPFFTKNDYELIMVNAETRNQHNISNKINSKSKVIVPATK